MNTLTNTSTGIIMVNSNGEITGSNNLAKSIINSDLSIKMDIDAILASLELNYRVEQIELEIDIDETQSAKYIYLIRYKSDYDSDFYKRILDNSHDEILVTDYDGNTIYCNNAVEKNYGVKRHEMFGNKFWLLEDTKNIGVYSVPQVIKEKKQVSVKQKTSTGKNLIVTATPVFNKNKSIEMIVANTRDITELESVKNTLEETKGYMEKYKKEILELRKHELDIGNELIFNNPKMKSLVSTIDRVAHVDANILILGESGTGKSAFTKYIHKISHRKNGPFITINCAAIPPNLVESELFGYATGAFTGAMKGGKVGLVELADGGTLFLDEIGELPLDVQAKFLEFIQEQRFTPVGGTKSRKVDIRVVSATNRDLAALVKEKLFREDLYYRLKVVELVIPPLRERPEDILSLISFFINKFDTKYKFSHTLSEECTELLINYQWPGNIRELQNIAEQLVVTVPQSLIEPYQLPNCFHKNMNNKYDMSSQSLAPLDLALEEFERTLFNKAYKQLGSTYKVANALGISQSKASRKLRKYLIDKTK